MDTEIRNALYSLEQTIRGAQGPVFTDADYGRALRAFHGVCYAMNCSDRRFRARAAEAERIQKEREQRSSGLSLLDELDEILGISGGASDD